MALVHLGQLVRHRDAAEVDLSIDGSSDASKVRVDGFAAHAFAPVPICLAAPIDLVAVRPHAPGNEAGKQ
ncbi:hypothetical protein [Sphingomonas sp.]|uniref:hypothetical protein n=1 Tax=Sphingomonas sp. TaxID=28214 RepID=UPI0031D93588